MQNTELPEFLICVSFVGRHVYPVDLRASRDSNVDFALELETAKASMNLYFLNLDSLLCCNLWGTFDNQQPLLWVCQQRSSICRFS